MTAAVLLVAALLLVPGSGAALALAAPSAISVESRIALAFGLGYSLVAAVATLLAFAHLLSAPAFVAGVVLATAAVWTLALRRAPLRAHASALRGQAREAPFALAAGLLLLLGVAASRPLVPAELNLSIAGPWRYWADGLELAAAGHVPAESAQWGLEIPTTVNKVVLNAFQAGVSFLLGPEPLPAMEGILVVTVVGLVAALLALGRELGLGIFAPLLPVLTVLVPDFLPLSEEIADDLSTYKAENVGRLVAFCALLLGIQVARGRGGRSLAAVAGGLLAVAGLTHLVPALVAGATLVFYLLAVGFRSRAGLRRALAGGAVIAAVFGATYFGSLGLAGGALGFERATSGAEFTGFPATVDPTLSFATGRLVRSLPRHGHFLFPPDSLIRRYEQQTVGFEPGDSPRRYARLGQIALAALAVATLLMVLVARRLIPVAAVAWGLVVTFVAVAVFFSYRYRTWVPATFGYRRLYDYAVFPPGLLLSGLLAALVTPLSRRRPGAVAALALAVGALAVAAAIERVPDDRSPPQAAAGVSVMEHVADVVPCGARMLVNARTAGSWEALTGRRSLTEGMAPYLRPEVMERVLPVLLEARAFFDDPDAHRAFLSRRGVQYVAVVDRGAWIGSPGGLVFPGSEANALASLPGLRPIMRDARVAVFAVGSGGGESGAPPGRCPL